MCALIIDIEEMKQVSQRNGLQFVYAADYSRSRTGTYSCQYMQSRAEQSRAEQSSAVHSLGICTLTVKNGQEVILLLKYDYQ
jgi:uncharacterized lipoprotein